MSKFDTIYRVYSYELYEFMFSLKIQYKRCTELHNGNYEQFYDKICSQTIDFISRVYVVFIEPVSEDDCRTKIYNLCNTLDNFIKAKQEHTIEFSDTKNEYIYLVARTFIEIFEHEYLYYNENLQTLSDGKMFLKYPHLSHTNLFYKKIKPEDYKKVFQSTPVYRRMDLLANYTI